MTNSVKLSTIDVAKDVLKEYGGAMRFEYREVSDGISIDAVYGDIGEVVIPDMIDGKPVRETVEEIFLAVFPCVFFPQDTVDKSITGIKAIDMILLNTLCFICYM